jgi:RNA-directed DNA polymerase
LTKRSQAVKILAVFRITKRNTGKNTAGVDGVAIPKGDTQEANKIAMRLLNVIDIKAKPDAIRRVFIPKGNGKKRPLGIPTLRDRINQEILRIALEPIVEYHSYDHSFGFRPKRRCQDAIALLYNKLGSRYKPRYIVEGDIKGCFDNISHTHIVEKLKAWQVPSQAISLINSILKGGIFYKGYVYDSETGTPQGGVISPLLANVALTTLDDFIETHYSWGNGRNRVNPLVRYADDFVIICKSKTIAVEIKEAVKRFLHTHIGLTLSEEKTKITHIYKGFNFLGFTIRKYKRYKNKPCVKPSDYILLITPQKEKIQGILRECIGAMNRHKTDTQNSLIHLLNPKVIGWANYYRYVVSSQVFGNIDRLLWEKTLHWAKRRHPQKSMTWIIQKYYSRQYKRRILQFTDKKAKSTLGKMSSVFSKKRFVKVKKGMRIYNADHAEYWNKREYHNTQKRLYAKRVRILFEKQNGLCPYCKSQITEENVVNSEAHVHHMLPRTFGGTERYSNLRLLHNDCHVDLHKRLSRKEMAGIVKTQRLDYINAKCY